MEAKQYPNVNPRLMTYYAIFSSAILGIYVILLIFEQLGLDRSTISYLGILVPLSITTIIGLACSTDKVNHFFVADRSVPSAYSGFAMACTAFGGAGLLGFIGIVFFIGFDAMAIGLGWAAGFALLAVLFAPAIRKMGAYSLPGYFSQRFESSMIHFCASIIVLFTSCLLLIAEIQLGAFIASFIFDLPPNLLMLSITVFVIVGLTGGGMRSLTWAQCAQFIIVLLGLLVPLTIVAIQLTNLPLPQLTYGSMLDDLTRLEQSNGLTETQPVSLSQAIPTELPAELQKLFSQNFGLISRFDFVLLTLCLMFGVATLPGLMTRLSTIPSASDARRSAGWGLAFIALICVSVPAYAVFTKLKLFQLLPQFPVDQLPQWIIDFEEKAVFAFTNIDKPTLDMTSLNIARDGISVILPLAADLPYVLVILSICSVILLAIASTSAHIMTMVSSLSHDLFFCLMRMPASKKGQVTAARICIFLIAGLGLMLAVNSRFDSFKLLAWVLSISGSAFFAPLALSVWWEKCTKSGALAGMLGGAGTAMVYIWFYENGISVFGLEGILAATLGVPISFILTITISLSSQQRNASIQNTFEELHIPGGEPIYDRALRAGVRRRKG